MATLALEKLTCPKCGHQASGVKPGNRCPQEDGYALVDPGALVRAGSDPFLGRVLCGRYPLIDVLGAGGMGAVYQAIQEPVGRIVAIKVIRPDAKDQDPGVVARFQREARATARLEHENVVSLYDHGQDEDGTLFLVMEYLRGATLSTVLRARRVLPPDAAVAIMCPVLSALDAAHEVGIVHRDLKPDNIMLVPNREGDERVKVLDFGVAKLVAGEKDNVHTRQNLLLGTPLYMSPEVAIGEGVTASVDLYAAGVILYEMLTGMVPFTGATPYAVLTMHATVPPLPFTPSLAVPAALEAVVMRALAKRPAERFPSAKAMSEALRLSIGGVPVAAAGLRLSGGITRPSSEREPHLPPTLLSTSSQMSGQRPTGDLTGPVQRGRGRTILLLAAAASVLGGGGWFLFGGGSHPSPPSSPEAVSPPPAAVAPPLPEAAARGPSVPSHPMPTPHVPPSEPGMVPPSSAAPAESSVSRRAADQAPSNPVPSMVPASLALRPSAGPPPAPQSAAGSQSARPKAARAPSFSPPAPAPPAPSTAATSSSPPPTRVERHKVHIQ